MSEEDEEAEENHAKLVGQLEERLTRLDPDDARVRRIVREEIDKKVEGITILAGV